MTDWEERADDLAAASLAAGDPTGWFEALYAEGRAGEVGVPWDSGQPRATFVAWARARGLRGDGRRALVVGCGLGQDAEYVAGLGFDTVAFDIAPTAIEFCRRRFPDSRVEYRTADLLDPPAAWRRAFDLVVEVYTVQALPVAVRATAIANVSPMVAPGGTLIVVAAADTGTASDVPPWPLSRAEIDAFAPDGLRTVRVERLEEPDVVRWRAEFRRPERSDAEEDVARSSASPASRATRAE